MKKIFLFAIAATLSLSSCHRNSGEAHTRVDDTGQEELLPTDNTGADESADSANNTYLYHQGSTAPSEAKKELNPVDSTSTDGHNESDSANHTYQYHH